VRAFDLDSIEGRKPIGDPQLCDPQDRIKLKAESGGLFEDLPRGHDNTAIIAELRNDENLIVAGLHAAFLLFHNRAVDWIRGREPSVAPEEAFEDARSRMVVINDRMLQEGDEVAADLRLERIDPDGIVLNFRGYRFLAPR